MNLLFPRFLRSAYRRDPVVSFMMTIGAVDVAMGGMSTHGGLVVLGLVVFGGALGLKWIQSQRRPQVFSEPVVQQYLPQQYLPPHSSQTELPMLSINKKQPPH